MASNGKDEKESKDGKGHTVSRKTRFNDDLQLLKMILDENTPLRDSRCETHRAHD